MYECVKGINFVSVFAIYLYFEIVSTVSYVVFFVFFLLKRLSNFKKRGNRRLQGLDISDRFCSRKPHLGFNFGFQCWDWAPVTDFSLINCLIPATNISYISNTRTNSEIFNTIQDFGRDLTSGSFDIHWQCLARWVGRNIIVFYQATMCLLLFAIYKMSI